ncbi:hypothetical protein BN140_3020 [Methanoculleus bourgensis MS2]|uniref:Uncharacterized protein n=1 Tax=Methanoculleus bourgensis (strain ATCC 43281 / DSM 3045 / OCM 15 / MS2) TaxID=1201294 RepID=W6Q8Q1_METBM|nr:hypothetical protein BN140_3020 [Methanoculleus bourgensis MS2]
MPPGIASRGGRGKGVFPHWRERNHGGTAFWVGYRRGSSSVELSCRFWCSSPPTSAWVVNAEYPRALPGQWTVVGIALGVGAGEGARPLPAGGDTANPPPRPACGLLPRPLRGRGQCMVMSEGKPYPRHDKLPVRTGRALADCPRQGSRPFSEEVDDCPQTGQ